MKNCQTCTKSFEISEVDKKYYDTIEVPVPHDCPDCRQLSRLIWRNERMLYPLSLIHISEPTRLGTCDATEKRILSVYKKNSPFPVYDNEYWYSDDWDPLDYGRNFDFSKTFYEQFQELMHQVPQLARSAVANQNSDYVNQCGWCKNCYLIFEADFNENCMYSTNIYDSRSCIDNLSITNCELCYECIDCQDCYNVKFSQDSKNCSDSWFLKNCIGLKNCFGCVNLKNKEYYFLNEKCTPEEYRQKLEELDLETNKGLQDMRNTFQEFLKKYPQKYIQGVQNEDSTGNYVSNTQRCQDCYDLQNSQDCRFVTNSRNMKNCYDITVFGSHKGAELCYYTHETGDGTRNIQFSDQIWSGCYDISYSKLCLSNCHHLFGCVGLKKQSYCILNKKYEPEEYEKLKARIIEHMKETGEWGKFFPKEICPFSYNETMAIYYYPLTKEQAIEKGYKWKDVDPKEYQPATTEIPNRIKDAPADFTKNILVCKTCTKNYKTEEEEMRFYMNSSLPIPPNCHECRHQVRFNLRRPRKLHDRQCDKCQDAIKTTYNSQESEQVYCQKCYEKVII